MCARVHCQEAGVIGIGWLLYCPDCAVFVRQNRERLIGEFLEPRP